MEQDNNQNEFVDLSQVLNEADSTLAEEQAEKNISDKKVPGIYRFVFKLSGGVIKTEKQAQFVVVILIVLMNVVTVSLILKGTGSGQISNTETPAQAM